MNTYEKVAMLQIRKFEKKILKKSEIMGWTKGIQQKCDGLIPQKVHVSLATALEKGVKAFLQGINLMPMQQMVKVEIEVQDDLQQLTQAAEKIILTYKRIASVEGAGTGYGGFLLSAVDFPALISIKLKMLQELFVLFGYRLQNFEDRLFLLKVFQLQFSGQECKQKYWQEIKTWEKQLEHNEWQSWENFNWEEFYMEYKQSIELKKLLQMIPGFGAIVGAWANYTFLEDLGQTALKCLQLRYLQQRYEMDIVR